MHERLKHLIVSSEKFKEKKKAEYNTQTKTRQTNKGMGRHLEGVKTLVIGGKGKGKQFYVKDDKPKIPSYYASRSKQAPGSTIGTINKLFCFI